MQLTEFSTIVATAATVATVEAEIETATETTTIFPTKTLGLIGVTQTRIVRRSGTSCKKTTTMTTVYHLSIQYITRRQHSEKPWEVVN